MIPINNLNNTPDTTNAGSKLPPISTFGIRGQNVEFVGTSRSVNDLASSTNHPNVSETMDHRNFELLSTPPQIGSEDSRTQDRPLDLSNPQSKRFLNPNPPRSLEDKSLGARPKIKPELDPKKFEFDKSNLPPDNLTLGIDWGRPCRRALQMERPTVRDVGAWNSSARGGSEPSRHVGYNDRGETIDQFGRLTKVDTYAQMFHKFQENLKLRKEDEGAKEKRLL